MSAPLKMLFVGGTGEISRSCVEEAVRGGHDVTVYNRGRRAPGSSAVRQITGDVGDDAAYARLAATGFDVVCQFLGFDPEAVRRDVELFSGRCAQYVFISSASAYQKPCRNHVITEDTPLDNPFWAYSRSKAACEVALAEASAAGKLPVTVVRPSHTYRERLPSTVIDGDHLAWRILAGKPVIVQGDGESLWTLTRSEDFARAFVMLCGNPVGIGATYHITDSNPRTWNAIVRAIGTIAGRTPAICHVASERLVRYRPDWLGPLLGDKSNSVVFDNARIASAVGGWRCEIPLREGLERAYRCAERRLAAGYRPEPALDGLIDRIIDDQAAAPAP